MSDTPTYDHKAGLIYIDGEDVPVFEALDRLTDEVIDAGEYCNHTVLDLVHELRLALAPEIADANMRQKRGLPKKWS